MFSDSAGPSKQDLVNPSSMTASQSLSMASQTSGEGSPSTALQTSGPKLSAELQMKLPYSLHAPIPTSQMAPRLFPLVSGSQSSSTRPSQSSSHPLQLSGIGTTEHVLQTPPTHVCSPPPLQSGLHAMGRISSSISPSQSLSIPSQT